MAWKWLSCPSAGPQKGSERMTTIEWTDETWNPTRGCTPHLERLRALLRTTREAKEPPLSTLQINLFSPGRKHALRFLGGNAPGARPPPQVQRDASLVRVPVEEVRVTNHGSELAVCVEAVSLPYKVNGMAQFGQVLWHSPGAASGARRPPKVALDGAWWRKSYVT